METRSIKSVVMMLIGSAALAGPALAAPSGDEIMQRNLSTTKVMDSTSGAEFDLINSAGQQRVRDTDGQTKLIPGATDNRRLVTFLSPADVRGTKTLLIEHSNADDDIWIYLPAMKKVRKAYETETRMSEKWLKDLAAETGGRIFLPLSTAEMIAKGEEVARDIGAEYVVTYRPTRPLAEAQPGEYRNVEVASRRVGLYLRSRRGYVVPNNQ